MTALHCAGRSGVQGPSSRRVSSDRGRAVQQAAAAEADMTEAGDVGEWLGMDSSKKVVARNAAVNGRQEADSGQQHRLSKSSNADQVDEVYDCQLLLVQSTH